MIGTGVPPAPRTTSLPREDDIPKPPGVDRLEEFSQERFDKRIAVNGLASQLAAVAETKNRGWLPK